ncbi:tetraspanin-7-like [Solanum dulcamara]|uniref:tetraspanin-7-like n=1 Tax=Solanum dulcamara TaxID=45834 RepID=UPI0024854308|nr:tetraspanin-7-like [Solanum dulcamara]
MCDLVVLDFLGLLCLSLFGVLVTNRNASRALFGRDGNYSHYLLKKYVLNAENWEQIKSSLIDFKVCQTVVELLPASHLLRLGVSQCYLLDHAQSRAGSSRQ